MSLMCFCNACRAQYPVLGGWLSELSKSLSSVWCIIDPCRKYGLGIVRPMDGFHNRRTARNYTRLWCNFYLFPASNQHHTL